jgi:hypothetical protein
MRRTRRGEHKPQTVYQILKHPTKSSKSLHILSYNKSKKRRRERGEGGVNKIILRKMKSFAKQCKILFLCTCRTRRLMGIPPITPIHVCNNCVFYVRAVCEKRTKMRLCAKFPFCSLCICRTHRTCTFV